MDEMRSQIVRAQSGDVDAVGEIVKRFQPVAYRYAYTILRSRELAEDATQEAFVQAFLHLPSLREPSAFAGWFRAVVHNCSRRLTRGVRVNTLSLDDVTHIPSNAPTPAELVETNELLGRIMNALNELPAHERDVTRLFYLDGHSQRDIADILGLPVSTVNNRIHSSRRRLRRALQPELEEAQMALKYDPTVRKLLRGDAEVTIRVMTREDIPAMRRLDEEIDASLDFANAQRPPGGESGPGGPWSDDQELARHFDKYEASGNVTLLAENEAGKLVGFAELWATNEPEPFGASLDAECTDYLWEYYHLGIETILLQEAEKVARAAGLPALDIGTNTGGGDYPTYRRLGMSVFYEYDDVWCKCKPALSGPKPSCRVFEPAKLDTSGLVRVNHWAPADFDFEQTPGRPGMHEFSIDGHRIVADLWRYVEPGSEVPTECEVFASPAVLKSPQVLSKIARVAAYIAGEAGSDAIPVPFPCDVAADPSQVEVVKREFAFAWLRKKLSD